MWISDRWLPNYVLLLSFLTTFFTIIMYPQFRCEVLMAMNSYEFSFLEYDIVVLQIAPKLWKNLLHPLSRRINITWKHHILPELK